MSGLSDALAHGIALSRAESVATLEGYAASSWWTEGNFYARMHQEYSRIRRSRFGRMASLTEGPMSMRQKPTQMEVKE